MKNSVVLAAISASFAAGNLIATPDNFPACGTTCFGNMLNQASDLGCGEGGTTEDAVDGVCLCKNVDFSYGIRDCANAICSDGVATTVIQYGVDWCGGKGVVVGGLGATPASSVTVSPTATVSASATASEGSTDSGSASATDSDTSSGASAVDTATLTNSSGETTGTGVVIPVSTTDIVSTVTNSDGAVETTTVASTVLSTSEAASGSGTESGSATDSSSGAESTTFVTESTITASDSTIVTSATVTEAVSSTGSDGEATSTESDGSARQTAAPVGLLAAAGLAALML